VDNSDTLKSLEDKNKHLEENLNLLRSKNLNFTQICEQIEKISQTEVLLSP